MKLYHLTPKENLPSILLKGLIPNHSSGIRKTYLRDNDGVIWLTDDPEFIKAQQVTTEWIEHFQPVLLTVQIPDKNRLALRYRHEYVYLDNIDSKFIKVNI